MSKHTLWKNLSCDLTQDEISQYSQELARITGEQSEIEAQKKEVMSDFAAKLNKCTADGRVLARKIITKKEDRQVECDLEFDYKTGMVYTVRCDNGVTIDQRKLTEDERQQCLDLDGEESRRQEAEDKRNDVSVAPPIIEGEIPQIEHKPGDETGEDEISICYNIECSHYDAAEPNGCAECENVYECDQVVKAEQNGAPAECAQCHSARPDCEKCCNTCESICNNQQFCLVEEIKEQKQQAELAEFARRDGICKDWRFCDHKDICFLPENEIAGICFKDEPHRIPATETENKAAAHAKSTNTIELPVEAFADKSPLRKIMAASVGIPDNGIIKKVYTHDGILFATYASMTSGAEGVTKVYAYQMVERSRWNEDVMPVVSLAQRMAEPRKSHLIYTGCAVTFGKEPYVLYRPTEFVPAPTEVF